MFCVEKLTDRADGGTVSLDIQYSSENPAVSGSDMEHILERDKPEPIQQYKGVCSQTGVVCGIYWHRKGKTGVDKPCR